MANKTTAKKPAKKKASPQKSKKTAPKQQERQKAPRTPQTPAQRQRTALILMASALILLAITLISGERAWAAVHNFVFGVFGVCSYAWPLMLIYLAVMFALNKPLGSVAVNLAGIGGFITFLSGIVHVAWDNVSVGDLGEQIEYVWDERMAVTAKSGGVLGAVIGGGLDALAGKTGALIILIVLALLILMLLTGTTLISAFNFFSKPVKKVGSYTEEKIGREMEKQRQKREEQKEFSVPPVKKRKFVPIDVGPAAVSPIGEEKEQEQDSIFLNKRNEAHQVVHAASGAGHRKILFVHRDSKERLHVHKNPGFTYYHVREELLSPASDSVCDICTFHDFTEMLSKKTPFQYTMLYFSFTLARNVMEALDQHGVRVPEDVSCLVYGKSDPRFFHGLEPDSIDFRQPMEDLIGNWFEQRIFSKETSGTFREELFPALLPGQTIRNIN